MKFISISLLILAMSACNDGNFSAGSLSKNVMKQGDDQNPQENLPDETSDPTISEDTGIIVSRPNFDKINRIQFHSIDGLNLFNLDTSRQHALVPSDTVAKARGKYLVSSGAGTGEYAYWAFFVKEFNLDVVQKQTVDRTGRCGSNEVVIGMKPSNNTVWQQMLGFPLICAALKSGYKIVDIEQQTNTWGYHIDDQCPGDKVLVGQECDSIGQCIVGKPYHIHCGKITE